MSKANKRARKLREHREQQKAEFMDWAGEVAEDADDFLEHASPFEISCALSEIGITTAHRSGIEEIFRCIVEELKTEDASPEIIIRGLLTGIVDQWKSELKAKSKSADLEDLVFLFQTARHLAVQWVRVQMRSDDAAIVLESGLTKPSLADFQPFKKSEMA